MTDPTPTRAEDARIPDHCAWEMRGHWSKAYEALLEDYKALRERAEAAEKAEAAAWNDAIEAAEAAYAHGFAAIRALRRAAPTEGEA